MRTSALLIFIMAIIVLFIIGAVKLESTESTIQPRESETVSLARIASQEQIAINNNNTTISVAWASFWKSSTQTLIIALGLASVAGGTLFAAWKIVPNIFESLFYFLGLREREKTEREREKTRQKQLTVINNNFTQLAAQLGPERWSEISNYLTDNRLVLTQKESHEWFVVSETGHEQKFPLSVYE